MQNYRLIATHHCRLFFRLSHSSHCPHMIHYKLQKRRFQICVDVVIVFVGITAEDADGGQTPVTSITAVAADVAAVGAITDVAAAAAITDAVASRPSITAVTAATSILSVTAETADAAVIPLTTTPAALPTADAAVIPLTTIHAVLLTADVAAIDSLNHKEQAFCLLPAYIFIHSVTLFCRSGPDGKPS